MGTRTLAQLRADARQWADLETSAGTGPQHVAAAELTRRINEAHIRLYQKLSEADGAEYFRTSWTGNTVANEATTSLPTDLFKLLGVDVAPGATLTASELSGLSEGQTGPINEAPQRLDPLWRRCRPFNFNERHDYQQTSLGWQEGRWVRYDIERVFSGARIRWKPRPGGIHAYRFWYVPEPVDLADDADTVTYPMKWEQWIAIACAIYMRVKQERSFRDLTGELDRLEAEIVSNAREVDKGEPRYVRDERWRRHGGSSGYDDDGDLFPPGWPQ